MYRIRSLIIIPLFISITTYGVTNRAFSFLEAPISSRLNALGGSNVAINDGDLSMGFCNPALLDDTTHNVLQFNYCRYTSWVNMGSALYGYNFNRRNYFAVGFHFISYGKMDYMDETGNPTGGTFSATDMVISALYTRPLNQCFTIGVALKPIYSVYEHYHSFVLGIDVGGHFQTRDSCFHLGLTFKNIGWQLKRFYEGASLQKLPFNIELAFAYKFKNAPFRLGMTYHDLQHWNLDYDIDALTSSRIKWGDMFFRHTIFFVDVLPRNERFYLTLSYNHRRNRELHSTSRSLVGFALGAGVRVKQCRIDASISQLTKCNMTFQVGVSISLRELLR